MHNSKHHGIDVKFLRQTHLHSNSSPLSSSRSRTRSSYQTRRHYIAMSTWQLESTANSLPRVVVGTSRLKRPLDKSLLHTTWAGDQKPIKENSVPCNSCVALLPLRHTF